MKEQRTTPIKIYETLTPSGKRFYYNHTAAEVEGQKIYIADFVETQTGTRADIIQALIAAKYSHSHELATQRKALAAEAGAQEEFNTYNAFVNECKAIADAPTPTMDWLKAEIEAYLTARQIDFPASYTKQELLNIIY